MKYLLVLLLVLPTLGYSQFFEDNSGRLFFKNSKGSVKKYRSVTPIDSMNYIMDRANQQTATSNAQTTATQALTIAQDNSSSITAINTTPPKTLGKFLSRLEKQANVRRMNIRLVTTSIGAGNSFAFKLASSIQTAYGKSSTTWMPFASQAAQPISGWRTQYYSGTYSIRLKGSSSATATPIVLTVKASKLVLAYSTEIDGGMIGVTTKTGSATTITQPSINCTGSTSFGNLVTYVLDPSQPTSLTLTPPSTGYGYLEYYIQDQNDFGISIHHTGYGGSALGNHAGTLQRTAESGMEPTATPAFSGSVSLGLISTFAPTDAQVYPGLIFYTGPTNDAIVGSATYANSLMQACSLAVSNGSSMILAIEPINSGAFTNSTYRANWNTCRAAFYACQAAYPDNVFVADWDSFMSNGTLAFNPRFHNSNLNDPHPGEYGFGDPHVMYAAELSRLFGLPNPKNLTRTSSSILATQYSQATEPVGAPTGSIWVDTSNPTSITKRLVNTVSDSRGLWHTESGDNINLASPLLTGALLYGTWTPTTNFFGLQADAHSAVKGINLSTSIASYVSGQTYTISYSAESQATTVTGFSPYLLIGNSNGPWACLTPTGDWVVTSTGITKFASENLLGPGDIRRRALTFVWPTASQLADFTAAGVNTASLIWRFDAPTGGATVHLWDTKIELGASLTSAYIAKSYRATSNVSGVISTTEPATGNVTPNLAWTDNSTAIPTYKTAIEPGGITLISSNTATGTGASVWRKATTGTNILVSPATTLEFNGGSYSMVTGTYGPGAGASGFRVEAPSSLTSNARIKLTQGTTNLVAGDWYTISFLYRWNYRTGDATQQKATILMGIQSRNGSNNLQSILTNTLQTWSTSGYNVPVWTLKSDLPGYWTRQVMKFKAYSSTDQPNAAGVGQEIIFQLGSTKGYWVELCDFRVEPGMGFSIN